MRRSGIGAFWRWMDREGAAATASEENYAAWREARQAVLTRASEPSLSVRTVILLAGAEAEASTSEVAHEERTEIASADIRWDVQVEIVERGDGNRPGGRRFGDRVHAMLESIDFNASADAIQVSAVTNGRVFGVRRETPVLLTLDDGSLVEGVVDLAFREETPDFAGWSVVDFKTDQG